MELMERYNRK